MKKMVSAAVILVVILAMPAFCADRGTASGGSNSSATKGSMNLFAEPIPDGKAIIYICNPTPGPLFVPKGWGNAFVFSREGPRAVLAGLSFYAFITDPGAVELFFMLGSGGQGGLGMVAKKLVVEVAAGQAVFTTFAIGPEVKVLPYEVGIKDEYILRCKNRIE